MINIFNCFKAGYFKRNKTRYGLLLKENGPNMDNVATIVRSYTGLDSGSVAKMMEHTPVMILDNVSNGVALGAMRALDMAGAETVMVKHEDDDKPSGGKKFKVRYNLFTCLNIRPLPFQPAQKEMTYS